MFRGLGILLMVMGHTNSFSGYFDKFIHAFHVPMFFVISGYLFRVNESSLSIIKKRVRSLLVPYFIFGGIHVLRATFIENTIKIEFLENYLLWSKEGMPVPGTCWFLMVMFWADIIYAIVQKKMRGTRQIITVVLITCIGLSFQFIEIKTLWGLDSALVAVGLMYIGSFAKRMEFNRYIHRITTLNMLDIIICGIAATGVILWTPYINMRTANYGIWPIFFVNVVVACAIGISISKKVEFFLGENKFICYLKRVGRNSIVYLCCNQLIIESIKNYIYLENTYFTGIALLFITCFIIEIVSFFVYNTKLKILVGK